MVKRFHCKFKNCDCNKFQLFYSGRCKYCNHGTVWHSLKEIPLKTKKSQYFSLRKSARKPIYISDKQLKPTIFIPIPIVNAYPIENNYRDYNFSITVEALPV